MISHKYQVGQKLVFKPNYMSTLSGAQDCKITRLMPLENGSRVYRIQCIADNLERVALEHQLYPQLML